MEDEDIPLPIKEDINPAQREASLAWLRESMMPCGHTVDDYSIMWASDFADLPVTTMQFAQGICKGVCNKCLSSQTYNEMLKHPGLMPKVDKWMEKTQGDRCCPDCHEPLLLGAVSLKVGNVLEHKMKTLRCSRCSGHYTADENGKLQKLAGLAGL